MSHLAVRDASRPRSLRQSDIQTRLDSIPTVDPTQSALSFVLLFVHARDALVLADVASGRITRWNPAAEELFGYTLAQAVGRPIEMLMTPAVARLHHERVGHYLRTGETDILATRTPLGVPAVTSSGEEIRVELSMLPMEVPGVRAFSILFTFRDAGSEKRAELSALEASRAESARQETGARLRSCEALLRESPRDLERPVTRADRKSTRLNSSHEWISYAVFCSAHPRFLHSFPTRRSSDLPGVRAFSILFTFRDAGSEKRAELSALEASRAESARQETGARLRSCEALLRESPRDLERPVTR